MYSSDTVTVLLILGIVVTMLLNKVLRKYKKHKEEEGK